MLKPFIFTMCVAAVLGGLSAYVDANEQSSGSTQIPIWPGTPPGARQLAATTVETTTPGSRLIAGKPYLEVHHVSRPTITVYSPKAKNTGAAVIVFPGGGYKILAIDLEGTEVCDWLTASGITCVLLKYRVPDSGPHWSSQCQCQITPRSPAALQDAQRAMSLVRNHAAEWHIDPHKIGVLGFSAGGHLAAAISTHFQKRSYPLVDEVDQQSCRPDFAVAIYPGHLWLAKDKLELNPDIRVAKETPPTFLLQAEDDDVDDVNHSLVYYFALKKAGVPVEMHLYAHGGHAFGLRPTLSPITSWPQLVEAWLKTIEMLTE
jgi:acetyl esterase/lipase